MIALIPRSPDFFTTIAARTLASVRQTQPPKQNTNVRYAQPNRPKKK